VNNEVEGLLTPTWITFEDKDGNEWKALALVAPLNSEDREPRQFALSKDLNLKFQGMKVIRG
jgi:hypothetical protein